MDTPSSRVVKNVNHVCTELRIFQKKVLSNYNKDKDFNLFNFQLWNDLKLYHGIGIENVIKIGEIINSIPVHSAECERGFSKSNNIKTNDRTNLKGLTLEKLIMASFFYFIY